MEPSQQLLSLLLDNKELLERGCAAVEPPMCYRHLVGKVLQGEWMLEPLPGGVMIWEEQDHGAHREIFVVLVAGRFVLDAAFRKAEEIAKMMGCKYITTLNVHQSLLRWYQKRNGRVQGWRMVKEI